MLSANIMEEEFQVYCQVFLLLLTHTHTHTHNTQLGKHIPCWVIRKSDHPSLFQALQKAGDALLVAKGNYPYIDVFELAE